MDERVLLGQRLTGRHLLSRRMAGRLEGRSVLDVGCGAGWFLAHAVDSGCSRAVGIERSAALAGMLRRRLPAAEVFELDATRELAGLGRFDVVCAFDFMEHLPRGTEPGFLEQAAGVLEPGGRLLVSVPYRGPLSCGLDPAFLLGHRHYSPGQVRTLLEGAGFTVEEALFAGGIWEQLSVIWLYLFKWVFRSEMPFADWLERRRRAEYSRPARRPRPLRSSVTMFVAARPPGS